MTAVKKINPAMRRYTNEAQAKKSGATYTPPELARFVANEIAENFIAQKKDQLIRVLDPACGDGELLIQMIIALYDRGFKNLEIYGYDTDSSAIQVTRTRLQQGPTVNSTVLRNEDFLQAIACKEIDSMRDLFSNDADTKFEFDIIIANPPYVRTQILGSSQAQILAQKFGLTGRVDLYHAFLLAIADALSKSGTTGIITSNRFMTTKSGSAVRRELLRRLNITHVWDLGDTKFFQAAVLPALIFANKVENDVEAPLFSSIYEVKTESKDIVPTLFEAFNLSGDIQLNDGRTFHVQHGIFDNGGDTSGVWRISTDDGSKWLEQVDKNTWGRFRDIGKIRVGVKTCGDKIFIRRDWHELEGGVPELVRPLTTHHISRRYRASHEPNQRRIIYTHEVVNGKRQPIELRKYPKTEAYFEEHKDALSSRSYVIEAGRKWYEIWVPQDPSAWPLPKLIFRDIAEEPTFWIDLEGSVVNGDCYWLICQGRNSEDLLWLAAAIGNSTFIEKFYDLNFNNKLYSGRRRFMTQYVEQFPLPDPASEYGKSIIQKAKKAFQCDDDDERFLQLQDEIDKLVWASFGVEGKEI